MGLQDLDALGSAMKATEIFYAGVVEEISENLSELARTKEGRAKIRSVALDEDGVFILEKDHPLYEDVCIHHLYRREELQVNGREFVYMRGGMGWSYYPARDPRQRISLTTGTQVAVVISKPKPRPPFLSEEVPLSFFDKVIDSPARDHMLSTYEENDDLGRGLLDESLYTSLTLSPAEVREVVTNLKEYEHLKNLTKRGWDTGMAAVVFNSTRHLPQTMLLMNKDESGEITSIQCYTISLGQGGIGENRGQTVGGVSRALFRYSSLYNKKENSEFPVGTIFYEGQNRGRIRHNTDWKAMDGKAVMTTRVLKLQLPSNARWSPLYVHGTNREAMLGQPASGGCIRMSNIDVVEFAQLVPPGGIRIDVLNEPPPPALNNILR